MSNGEPQYKMVNGVLVELTPEEIAEREADVAQQQQQQAVASRTLDMGQSMADILGE